MMLVAILPLLTFLHLHLSVIEAHEDLVPYQSFVSRPDILAPDLDVRISKSEALEPGYIFLSTWHDSEVLNGPYIFDNSGELVWSGHEPSLSPTKYFNFQAHHFSNGTSVLSVFRGSSDKGRGKGHIALLDSSYNLIRTIASPSPVHALDFHEFQLWDDGRKAVVLSLQPIQADLSMYGIVEGAGWVLDHVFYCIDLNDDDRILFEWHASDHIPLTESVLPPTASRLAGMSYAHAYDYFHINSIDRFANGDFLLSARHTDTLYRISGINGSVLWRLGGPNSSFKLQDFTFSAQHDARIVAEEDQALVISLFDNAYNGVANTSNISSAIKMKIDFSSRKAKLLQQYFPLHGGLAPNQGSLQQLPVSGNALVSWGLIAEFSEFEASGKRVLEVAFADRTTRDYRISKADWIGEPRTDPVVYLYAKSTDESTHFWMSWNGASEVKSWNVYGGSTADRDSLTLLASVPREGFETHFGADKLMGFGSVEAVAENGTVLGRSSVSNTYIPPPGIARHCGIEHCTVQVLPAYDTPDVPRRAPNTITAPSTWSQVSWFYSLLWVVVGVVLGRMGWLEVARSFRSLVAAPSIYLKGRQLPR